MRSRSDLWAGTGFASLTAGVALATALGVTQPPGQNHARPSTVHRPAPSVTPTDAGTRAVAHVVPTR
jgi:hypothetical protein